MPTWDPTTYLNFADERSRPFFDLLSRVGATDPSTVVDLGCGPGQLTATLAERWPNAHVLGLDSSAEMILKAGEHASSHVEFHQVDLVDWRPSTPVDVLVINATLQWVPGHREVLPTLIDQVAPGGWLAFQVPGNYGEPSHRLLRALAAEPRFAPFTRHLVWQESFDAAVYLERLAALGCRVEAWETTYQHILTGPDPVFRWISGTGARPVLQALDDDHRDVFIADYKAQLRAEYLERPFGTLLPFRRIFVVAQKVA